MLTSHCIKKKKQSQKPSLALQLWFSSILGTCSFFNGFTLRHTQAHKEHSITSVFEAQRFLPMGEGTPRKANHSGHVSYINDKTAIMSFGSPVHQAKENWVIHTVNISYLWPQNNVWILCFKYFFLDNRKLLQSLHFNNLHIFNCSIKC